MPVAPKRHLPLMEIGMKGLHVPYLINKQDWTVVRRIRNGLGRKVSRKGFIPVERMVPRFLTHYWGPPGEGR